MNNLSRIYTFERWILIKKRLNQACMHFYDEKSSQAYRDLLLNCLKTLLSEKELEKIQACIEQWINKQVAPAISNKIKNHKNTNNSDLWADTFTLFGDTKRMAKAIARSHKEIIDAWEQGDENKAYRYLWTTLSHHFSDMRHISEICGTTKSRNWMIIETAIRQIQAESLKIDNEYEQNKYKDPAFLAPLILERCGKKLRDVTTVKGVIAYIQAFSPQESIDVHFDLFDYKTHTHSTMDLLLEYLEKEDSTLTHQEKTAVQLQYFEGIDPMTDQIFKKKYGYSRSTHKNRVKDALKKLNLYLSKYVTGTENV